MFDNEPLFEESSDIRRKTIYAKKMHMLKECKVAFEDEPSGSSCDYDGREWEVVAMSNDGKYVMLYAHRMFSYPQCTVVETGEVTMISRQAIYERRVSESRDLIGSIALTVAIAMGIWAHARTEDAPNNEKRAPPVIGAPKPNGKKAARDPGVDWKELLVPQFSPKKDRW